MGLAKHLAGFVAVGALLASSTISGCSVDVDVGFECDLGEGDMVAAGETFAIGCRQCECLGDGTVSCNDDACCIDEAGTKHEMDAAFAAPDGCNTCTCDESGQITCTEDRSCRCLQEPAVACDQPIEGDCWYEQACDEINGWHCVPHCACDEQLVPECPPPPGCFYEGPYCENDSWTCGELYCKDCSTTPQPECEEPPEPGCVAQPECYGVEWQCVLYCQGCEGKIPPCDRENEYLECDEMGQWQCVPFNATCGDVTIACDPGSGQDPCAQFPVCKPDGMWTCQENCDPMLCMEPMPECIATQQNCSNLPLCLSDGDWACVEYCE